MSTNKIAELVQKGEASISDAKRRFDSWVNALTGLGGMRDKATYNAFNRMAALPDDLLAALYHGDDIAARIVAALPEEAFKHGFEVTSQGSDTDAGAADDDKKTINSELERLCVANDALEAAVWGRLFGGAALLLGADDGKNPEEPLEDERVTSLTYVSVIDKRDLWPNTYYGDPEDEKFGEPETYRIQRYSPNSAVTMAENAVVHETRIIRFGGALTSRRDRSYNNGWDMSVLQRVYDVLRQANGNWQSACHLMTDMSQAVYKIDGLIQMLAAGQGGVIQTRMELVEQSRSTVRAVVLDAASESFERTATPMNGVDTMIDKTWQRLAAAARMPVTVLMGTSPAGLNATGESDIRGWYDQIRTFQESIEPKLNRIIKLIAIANGIGNPEEWHVKFPSIWQMTPVEEATYRKTVAETDAIYEGMGALLPEEIAIARFGGCEYSAETTIDVEARKAALDIGMEKMMNPPDETQLDPMNPNAPVPNPAQPPAVPGQEPVPPVKPAQEPKPPTKEPVV